MWNAIILHARWGGLIQQRGFAVMSVFGNVVTAWSWFGVNMLDVGLRRASAAPRRAAGTLARLELAGRTSGN